MAVAARTLVSRSGSVILEQVSAWASSRDPARAIIYSLSPGPDLKPSELSGIVSQFTSVPNSIGCLSSHMNLSDPTGPKKAAVPYMNNATICSWAEFDLGRSTLFRSTIPGTPVTQVGRWHAARQPQNDSLSELPPPALEGETWPRTRTTHPLPSEIAELDKKDIDTVIYFSDTSAEGISQSLNAFPDATTVGLLTTSTPFITGRPHTLFYNNEIHSSGAVGLCLNSWNAPKQRLIFPALRAIMKSCVVTSSEGNLIHTLDDRNPTDLLIRAMEQHKLLYAKDLNQTFREWNFYLGHVPSQTPLQVYRINLADPTRGTIALEGEFAPPVGSRVQFLYLPLDYVAQPPPVMNRPNGRVTLNFHTTLSRPISSYTLPMTPSPAQPLLPSTLLTPIGVAGSSVSRHAMDSKSDAYISITGSFIAASEHGMMLSRVVTYEEPGRPRREVEVKEGPWKASLPLGNFCFSFDPLTKKDPVTITKKKKKKKKVKYLPGY